MLQLSNSAKRCSKDRVPSKGSLSDTRSLEPGDTMRREKKSATLTIRLRPSVRAMAETRAREQNRGLASYIAQLIVGDAKAYGGDRGKRGFSD
jgi:hypothetical protein